MPEGDTIFKVAGALRPRLEGRTIRHLWLRRGGESNLAGEQVTAVRALGKHLFIELASGWSLRSHLGLWGTWHRYAPGERWRKPEAYADLVLTTDADVLVCFHAREIAVERSGGLAERDRTGHLGPDLLATDPDTHDWPARARNRLASTTLVGDVLLDQRVAAGIGNIYKSELLFIHRLAPGLTLGAVPDATLTSIYIKAAELLGRNVGGGPRTTRFAGRGDTLWVYGRANRRCYRCGTRIRYARMGADQRDTYWCPRCQSTPA